MLGIILQNRKQKEKRVEVIMMTPLTIAPGAVAFPSLSRNSTMASVSNSFTVN